MRSHLPARRLFALATVGAVMAFSGAALTAVPAAASNRAAAPPPVSFISLATYPATTTSTSNAHLKVSLTASKAPITASEDSVSVNLGNRTFTETHNFTFPTGPGALAVANSGRGTLKPGTKTGRYGTISMKIASTGNPHTRMCQGQPLEKTMPVTVNGVFLFKTHSTGTHKWGNLGSRHFHFRKATLTWTYNNPNAASCQNFSQPCSTGIHFGAMNGANSIFGSKVGRVGSVEGSRTVQLARPHGAIRSDSATGGANVSLKVNHNGSATLKVVGTGVAVGSATFKSTPPLSPPYQQPCGKNNAKHVTLRSWNGTYRNGRPPLKVRTQIFGGIKVSNVNQGAYFSKAS